jgi:hypothetical protein
MISDKDIEKMKAVFATSEDHVHIEKNVDRISEVLNENTELLKKLPTRDEFPELLKQTLEWVTLKTEHERMKKILHEKLQVDI